MSFDTAIPVQSERWLAHGSVAALKEQPHDEASEYNLIAQACRHPRMMKRCSVELTPDAFYGPSARRIFEGALQSYHLHGTATAEILAGVMSDLGIVVPMPDLMRATSGDASDGDDFFEFNFERVRSNWLKRKLLRYLSETQAAIMQPHAEDLDELIGEAETRLRKIREGVSSKPRLPMRSAMEFKSEPPDSPNILIGKYRYMARGGTGIVVGPSSIGKSSWVLLAAIHWALGKDFMGMVPNRKLRSWVIVGEDDEGDVGVVIESCQIAMGFTQEDIDTIHASVMITEERELSGEAFFEAIPDRATEFKADVVWVNPLNAFSGLDISKPGEVGIKLRPWLARSNPDKYWCTILVHHTNKPQGKDSPDRNWNEWMYNMTGSADLINTARFIISLEARKDRGEFTIRFAKRGGELGLTRQIPSESGIPHYEPVSHFRCWHPGGTFKTTLGHMAQMYFWKWDVNDVDIPVAEPAGKAKRQLASWAEIEMILRPICEGSDKAKPVAVLQRATANIRVLSAREFSDLMADFAQQGVVGSCSRGYYVIPKPGQVFVDKSTEVMETQATLAETADAPWG